MPHVCLVTRRCLLSVFGELGEELVDLVSTEITDALARFCECPVTPKWFPDLKTSRRGSLASERLRVTLEKELRTVATRRTSNLGPLRRR